MALPCLDCRLCSVSTHTREQATFHTWLLLLICGKMALSCLPLEATSTVRLESIPIERLTFFGEAELLFTHEFAAAVACTCYTTPSCTMEPPMGCFVISPSRLILCFALLGTGLFARTPMRLRRILLRISLPYFGHLLACYPEFTVVSRTVNLFT